MENTKKKFENFEFYLIQLNLHLVGHSEKK